MSDSTTTALVHVGWLGVSVFLGIAFGVLHLTRRVAREHGALAALAVGHVVLHLSAIGAASARSVATAAAWQNAHIAVIGILVPLLFEFVGTLTETPRRERVLARCAGFVAVLVGATGLGADPSAPSGNWPGGGTGVPAAMVTVGAVLGLALTLGALVMTVVRMALGARRDRQLVIPASVSTIAIGLLVADTNSHVVGSHLPIAVHHAPGIVLLVMAATLVVRAATNEQSLAKKSIEAGASSTRLAAARQELLRTEQLAAVGELSAVIAHEIRNPLAILRNAATGLNRAISDHDRQTLLQILDEEVDRLDRLLDDLLVYARPLAPDAREIELTDLVRQAAHLALEGQPTARGIDIAINPDAALCPVTGDPALLRHALINIFDNAILAMPAGGTITVRVRPTWIRGETPGYAIDVRDEGEGMDTLVRSRAKDAFFTTRQSGTGLGLAIVERVARVHGGEVAFESHGESGTTVTLSVASSARQSAVDLELRTGRFAAIPEIPGRAGLS